MKRHLLLILIVSSLLISSCSRERDEAPVTIESSGFIKGTSLSPRSFSAKDFTEFFQEDVQQGDIVMWAGDWNELSIDQGSPKAVMELASTYHYVPLIETTIHSAGQLIRPLNADTLQLYRSKALAFAEKYKPKYFGCGIEINGLYVKSPADFEEFVPFYNDLYDALKRVSPDTQVFTIFQLELMKGLSMWETEENNAHWELIDRFSADIVAFTTYPGLFYRDPSDIPKDHYTEIKMHTDKPIAFTEIGWHTEASPQGWESSEQEQLEFLNTFFELTNNLSMKIAIWSFMYDPTTIEPFRSMGLRRDDGTSRPAYDVWRKK